MPGTIRHVLGISGGKDSAALAIHMRERVPRMEYYFCDTQKELPETYEFLVRLEAYLGKPIARLNAQYGFDHWLKVYGGYLPSTRMRWCTRKLKIEPFEDWVGDDEALSYIGIRADEPTREAYISTKPNIRPVYPFRDDGIVKEDVFRILKASGVGVPKYYDWRTRSGCYFCFFQRKAEWLGLKERHPDLFELAKAYEKKPNGADGSLGFTWSQSETLAQIASPERAQQIRERYATVMAREEASGRNLRLVDLIGILEDVLGDEDDSQPCTACST